MTVEISYTNCFIFSLVIIALAVLYIYSLRQRQKAVKALGDKRLVSKLISPGSLSRNMIAKCLVFAAVICIAVPLCLPRSKEISGPKASAREIVILLDVSLSMAAGDVHPSRIEQAKAEIRKLLAATAGNRTGMMAFSRGATLISPLTSDTDYLQSSVRGLNTYEVQPLGTDIGSAIKAACNILSAERKGLKQSIFLFSDGEDHLNRIESALKTARENGIKIQAVGIGTDSGAPVPDLAAAGSYKKNSSGQLVISRLNVNLLKHLAAATGGSYKNPDKQAFAGQNSILADSCGEQTGSRVDPFSKNIYFRLPLIMAAAFLVAAICLS